jgi:hypothetical protein
VSSDNTQQSNQQGYTTREQFREYNSLSNEQNDNRKTFFKGKQASIGSSGEVKFKKSKVKEKKKGGVIKKLILLIVFIIVVLFLVSLFFGSNITNLQTTTGINPNTLDPTNATSTFATDTPEIFATFTVAGLPIGTDIQGEWVYEGEQAAVAEIYTTEEAQNAYFSFSIPDAGWPIGSYEINIYVKNEFQVGKKFTVR